MALSLESNKSGTAQVKSGDWATLVLPMCPVTPQMVRASSGPAGQCKVTTVGPPAIGGPPQQYTYIQCQEVSASEINCSVMCTV